jgi:thymidine kinase
MIITIKNMSSMSSVSSLMNAKGYLELIIGPMYSGKTSKLLEIYKQCKFCDISVCVINHSLDKRYHDSMLSSHDKVMVPCLNIENVYDLWFNDGEIDLTVFGDNINHKLIRKADVILINEGQFFNNLYHVVYDMLKNSKVVYVCGLDGDFERKKFGEILDLIPLCDKVTKLTSLCSLCKNGTPGIFSMIITNEKEQTVIGSENYLPVCRNCYDKKHI